MYKLKDKTILILSNEAWGDIWYSKHNWAFELSKTNKVYFINPPKKWRLLNLFKSKLFQDNISDSLSIISYVNILPFSRFKSIIDFNEKKSCKRLTSLINKKNNLIFWSFDPFRFTNPSIFSPKKSIYFITDKFQTKLENSLINNSDYIISVSPELTIALEHANILNLTHGISENEFVSEFDVEFDEFILYVGNIDHRIDYTLLKKMLIQFPNEKFLFIGKVNLNANKNFHELFIEKKFENLIIYGPTHFKNLKNYITKAKTCLAIMNKEVSGNNINHHKLLQYLAFGKPVLSPVFDDYSENKELIIGYKTDDEAIESLYKIIKSKEDAIIIQNRISFTKKHTYNKLINKVEVFLSREQTKN